ncbi:MAG: hypothetical protein KQH63_07665 [Desulfobulbaceae bacterium]|nr:hypothetical protein [Desulfobulbaceae bacterium]
MKPNRKIKKMGLGILFCALTFAPVVFPASGDAQEIDAIEIDVSPNVLNIAGPVEVLTVHTDIAYSVVDCNSVTLEVNEYTTATRLYCKSDNRGYFVGKFDAAPIKASEDNFLTLDDYNTFTMTGSSKEGLPFEGTQLIRVIEVIPVGLE